jgi:hypothetical protein
MGSYDEETERYLKEFRPLSIRPLEVAPQARNMLWRRLAAAAAMAVCAGGLAWFASREVRLPKETANVQAPHVSLAGAGASRTAFALTTLALADEERFETLLAEESRKSLPSFQGEQSMLRVLAKD